MKWATALSTHFSLEQAVKEVTDQACERLGNLQPDLGIVFISQAFASEFSRVIPLLQTKLHLPVLIGCGGGGVIGRNYRDQPQEVEETAGLSLTLAHLPDVQIKPFSLVAEDLPDPDDSPQAWWRLIGVDPEAQPEFILLADTSTARINDLLRGLDYAYPQAVKVGGITGSNQGWGRTGLFYQTKLQREGTVGLALTGNLRIDPIVAQGCRPIGPLYRIASGEKNIILTLEDDQAMVAPPLNMLQNLVETLPEADRELARNALFIGLVHNEFKPNLGPGDFLIRNLIGIDPQTGALALGDRVRVGQRIQFHLRDAAASAADLQAWLETYCHSYPGPAPEGTMMFSCLGRGVNLYGEPDFDANMVDKFLPNIPVSGFFCFGEIGPIGQETFLHGYTSALAIFHPRTTNSLS